MNTTHKGSDNLIPLSARTSDERREIAKKGGRCSGVARRKLKTQREIVKYIGNRQPELNVERLRKTFGISDDIEITTEFVGIARTFEKWIKTGDPKYGEFIRDTKGEKPKDEVDVAVNAPPIVIGIHDPGFIEAERRRQDQMLKDMGAGDVVDVEDADDQPEAEPTPIPAPDDAEKPSVDAEIPHSATENGTDVQKNCTSSEPVPQPPPSQTAEKPPVDAPKPTDGGRSPDKPQANVAQPGATAPQPAKRPMTRAEAVAAMEAERRAKGGVSKAPRQAEKPMFLPSGFGRRR